MSESSLASSLQATPKIGPRPRTRSLGVACAVNPLDPGIMVLVYLPHAAQPSMNTYRAEYWTAFDLGLLPIVNAIPGGLSQSGSYPETLVLYRTRPIWSGR
jgi:hypothetical protein